MTSTTVTGSDLVVEQAVMTKPSGSRRITAGIGLLVIGLFTVLAFGVGANSGDAAFALSQAGDTVHIPTIKLPATGTSVVLGVLIAVLGLVHLVRGFPRRAMRWVTAGVGVLFVVAFLCWAGSGSTGLPLSVDGMLQQSLLLAVPLILGSMAGVMCERTGVINIAIEGQMLFGAFAGALFSSLAGNLFVGIVAAVIAGGLIGLLLAVFAIKFFVNQVVLGVVLNLLALGLTGYFYQAFMASNSDKYNSGMGLADHSVPLLHDIPVIGPTLFETNWIVYAMYVIIIAINVGLFYTRFGLRTRAVGEHPRAAATVGITVRWTRYRNVTVGGMIAGLGGAFFTLGTANAFQANNVGITSGKGYIALAALIFGRWNPNGAIGASLLFGFTLELQPLFSTSTPVSIPSAFWLSLPYLITMLAVAGFVGRVTAPAADGEPYFG